MDTQQRSRSGAVTLVEVSVALLVIGILVSVGIVGFQQQQQNTRVQLADTTLRSVEQAALQLAADQGSPLSRLEEAASNPPEDLPGDVRIVFAGTEPRISYRQPDRDVCRTLVLTETGEPGRIFNENCETGDVSEGELPDGYTIPELSLPATPMGVAATAANRAVDVAWNGGTQPANVTYRVWTRTPVDPDEDDDSGWSRAGTTSSESFTISPMDAGEEVEVAVSAFTSVGESDRSDSAVGTAEDGPPLPPENVAAFGTRSSVTVSWSPPNIPDLESYVLRRAAGEATGMSCTDGTAIIDPVDGAATSVVDDNVNTGETYSYWLCARDTSGQLSDPSNIAQTSTVDLSSPRRPTGLDWNPAGATAVELLWSPPDSGPADRYLVYRDGAHIDTVAANDVATGGQLTYADEGLTTGQVSSYRVVTEAAIDDGDTTRTATSSPAGPVQAIPTSTARPAPPSAVSASLIDDGNVDIVWEASPDEDVERYDVWVRTTQPDRPWRSVGSTRNTSFTDTLVPGARDVYYRVRAVNTSQLTSRWVNAPEPVNPPDITPPPTPERPQVVGGEQAITVSWPGVRDRDGDLAGYRVRRTRDGGGSTVLVDVPADRTELVDDNVAAGVQYNYSVASFDQAGNLSDFSPSASGMVDGVAPGPVTGLQAERRPGAAQLSWNVTDDAAWYDVEVNGPDGTSLRFETDDTELRAQPLSGNVTYTVRVRAVNAARLAGTWALTSVTPASTSPLDEPALSGEPGDGRISLSWEADPRAVSTLVLRDGEEYATADGTSWVDADVTFGTSYQYQVVSVDEFSQESFPSNTITVEPDMSDAPEPPAAVTADGAFEDAIKVTVTEPSPSELVELYRVWVDGELSGEIAGDENHLYVEGLERFERYTVEVAAVNVADNESERYVIEDVRAGKMVAPDAPEFTIVQFDTYVRLDIEPVDDAALYEVHRDDELFAEVEPDPTTGGTLEVFNEFLSVNTNYTWKVRAVNEDGDPSEFTSKTERATVGTWEWTPTDVPATDSCGLELDGPWCDTDGTLLRPSAVTVHEGQVAITSLNGFVAQVAPDSGQVTALTSNVDLPVSAASFGGELWATEGASGLLRIADGEVETVVEPGTAGQVWPARFSHVWPVATHEAVYAIAEGAVTGYSYDTGQQFDTPEFAEFPGGRITAATSQDGVSIVGTEDGQVWYSSTGHLDGGTEWYVAAGQSAEHNEQLYGTWHRDGVGTDARFGRIRGLTFITPTVTAVTDGRTVRTLRFDFSLREEPGQVATVNTVIGNGVEFVGVDADNGTVYAADSGTSELFTFNVTTDDNTTSELEATLQVENYTRLLDEVGKDVAQRYVEWDDGGQDQSAANFTMEVDDLRSAVGSTDLLPEDMDVVDPDLVTAVDGFVALLNSFADELEGVSEGSPNQEQLNRTRNDADDVLADTTHKQVVEHADMLAESDDGPLFEVSAPQSILTAQQHPVGSRLVEVGNEVLVTHRDGNLLSLDGTPAVQGLEGLVDASATATDDGRTWPLWAITDDGGLWRVDSVDTAPVRMNPEGGLGDVGQVGHATAVAELIFGAPGGIAADSERVVVTDRATTAVWNIDVDSGDVTMLAGELSEPSGVDIAVDSGDVVVANARSGAVTIIGQGGSVTNVPASTQTGLGGNATVDVSTDQHGLTWAASPNSSQMLRTYPTGQRVTMTGTFGFSEGPNDVARLDRPTSVTGSYVGTPETDLDGWSENSVWALTESGTVFHGWFILPETAGTS